MRAEEAPIRDRDSEDSGPTTKEIKLVWWWCYVFTLLSNVVTLPILPIFLSFFQVPLLSPS